MTVLVIASHLSPNGLASILPRTKPAYSKFAEFQTIHQTRLVKPAISFDEGGAVLSYLPAAGELAGNQVEDDDYTFIHLQRDLFKLFRACNVEVSPQKRPGRCYVTLARFIERGDHSSGGKSTPASMASWVDGIERMNKMLKEEYWPHEGDVAGAGNWIVGGSNSLHIQEGTSWYGGGNSLKF